MQALCQSIGRRLLARRPILQPVCRHDLFDQRQIVTAFFGNRFRRRRAEPPLQECADLFRRVDMHYGRCCRIGLLVPGH
jgi:hypothetical protein